MARFWNGADYITAPSVTAPTLYSFYCRFYRTGNTDYQRIYCYNTHVENVFWQSGDFWFQETGWSGSPNEGYYHFTSSLTNQWVSLGITHDRSSSGNACAMYQNGAAQSVTTFQHGAGTHSQSADTFRIGQVAGATNRTWNGHLAEFAMWDVLLSADEHAALGDGFSPKLIRPSSLISYVPLVNDVVDRINGPCTNQNTTVSGFHPRVIYPQLSRAPFIVAASNDIDITPPVGNLTLSGTAPTVDQTTSESDQPAAANLTLSTTAPTVDVTANIALSPAAADAVLSTTAPTVDATGAIALSPAAANLTLSTTAPSVDQTTSESEQPAAADLVLSTTAPTVVQTLSRLPAAADLTLSGTAPTVDQTTSENISPSAGGLVISTTAPSVATTGQNTTITPDAAQFTLSTVAPTVTAAGQSITDTDALQMPVNAVLNGMQIERGPIGGVRPDLLKSIFKE